MREDNDAPPPSPELAAFLASHRDTGEPDEVAVARVGRVVARQLSGAPEARRRRTAPELWLAAAIVLLLGGGGLVGYFRAERANKAVTAMREAYSKGDFEAARAALAGCSSSECERLATVLQRASTLANRVKNLSDGERADLLGADQELKLGELPSAVALGLDGHDPELVVLEVGMEREMTVPGLTKVAIGDPGIADVHALGDSKILITGVSEGKTTMLAWMGSERLNKLIVVGGKHGLRLSVGDEVSVPAGSTVSAAGASIAQVTVSPDGKTRLLGVGEGQTWLFVTEPNGQKASRQVLVTPQPKPPQPTPLPTYELEPGADLTLPMRGVTSAQSIDDAIVTARVEGGAVMIHAGVAGATTVVVTTAQGNQTVQVVVLPKTLEGDLLNLGRSLFKQKAYRAAQRVLKACVARQPQAYQCFKVLGSTEARLGDPDASRVNYEKYLELAPKDDPDYGKVLGVVQR